MKCTTGTNKFNSEIVEYLLGKLTDQQFEKLHYFVSEGFGPLNDTDAYTHGYERLDTLKQVGITIDDEDLFINTVDLVDETIRQAFDQDLLIGTTEERTRFIVRLADNPDLFKAVGIKLDTMPAEGRALLALAVIGRFPTAVLAGHTALPYGYQDLTEIAESVRHAGGEQNDLLHAFKIIKLGEEDHGWHATVIQSAASFVGLDTPDLVNWVYEAIESK